MLCLVTIFDQFCLKTGKNPGKILFHTNKNPGKWLQPFNGNPKKSNYKQIAKYYA